MGSVFVTLLTSPNAARFRCPGAALEMEAFVADFFIAKAFLTMFSLPASLGMVSAAAFALVTRVEPMFSSFSLLTARCRIVRACIVY